MANKFFQDFLKTGLFDIGDNDSRLKWLQEAIGDLEKILQKDLSQVHKFTLVALDPNISENDPILIETETIITNRWNALRAKYVEMPRNLIRGVIINSLHNIGQADPIAARIIYLTALNFFPYAKLNSEKTIVEEMLLIFGELAEKQAIEEWSFIEEEPKLRLTTLKLTDFSFNSSEFDKSSLKTGLRVAVKNNPQTGEGSQSGGETAWGDHFATKATDAIASSLQTALETLNPASIETPINKFFTEFKKSLDGSLKTAFSSLKAVERRSKLLWWKETLYSITLKKSYREIEKNLLPILMSIDLNKQVPPITPISVDYLLKDTLFLLNQKQDEMISFLDYLTEISKDENKELLKPHLIFSVDSEGRISITQFLALLIDDRVKITTFKEKTGIDPAEKISLEELSVVILHDLLIQRLK